MPEDTNYEIVKTGKAFVVKRATIEEVWEEYPNAITEGVFDKNERGYLLTDKLGSEDVWYITKEFYNNNYKRA